VEKQALGQNYTGGLIGFVITQDPAVSKEVLT
jgi:hypothetical protein